MASLTMTLEQKDVEAAIEMWLRSKGLQMKGAITIHHDPGDRPCDSPSTTIGVQCEPISAPAPPTTYDR
jgi:hypothetical protein